MITLSSFDMVLVLAAGGADQAESEKNADTMTNNPGIFFYS
jgi:hypothetical protein